MNNLSATLFLERMERLRVCFVGVAALVGRFLGREHRPILNRGSGNEKEDKQTGRPIDHANSGNESWRPEVSYDYLKKKRTSLNILSYENVI
ncbi:hypothetical protein KPH14_011273 [Odynerus spinipes]|uniref:Uncharacterized protein n=1 Tax=Odynerus spinipes TaxID=1348599 RepID=A0AAD9VJ29_9HYME|nr:hypothetical protein KPH14_011273 [Odynerus spinipes]